MRAKNHLGSRASGLAAPVRRHEDDNNSNDGNDGSRGHRGNCSDGEGDELTSDDAPSEGEAEAEADSSGGASSSEGSWVGAGGICTFQCLPSRRRVVGRRAGSPLVVAAGGRGGRRATGRDGRAHGVLGPWGSTATLPSATPPLAHQHMQQPGMMGDGA